MYKSIKNNRGITIVSLIITIIVMIILASITIATVTGDNDLVQRAEGAKNAIESSDAEEKNKIDDAYGYTNTVGGGSITDHNGLGDKPGYVVDGWVDSDETPACTHTWGAGVVTVEATCEKNGLKGYTCTKCGGTKNEAIEALGHSYESKVTTNATSTLEGLTTHTCKNCGDSYSTIIPATGSTHTCKYDQMVATTDYQVSVANCEKAATYYYSCECGQKGTDTFTVGEALGHVYELWTVTKSPTCTETGTRSSECTVCAYVNTETIKALGHNVLSWTVTKQPTCTETGSKTGTCTRTGCSHTEVEEIEVLGHTADNGTLTKAATCVEAGIKTYTCTTCNTSVKREKIAALGHLYTKKTISSTYLKSEATCTDAAVYYYSCSRCGGIGTEYFTDGTELGHDFSSSTNTCTRCGISNTSGAKCAHTNKTTYYASAGNSGHKTWNKCNTCGNHILVSNSVSAHSFSNSTCSTCGFVCEHTDWNEGTCAICGHNCSHENESVVNDKIVYNGDGTHTVYTLYLNCEDVLTTKISSCSYKDGKCTICGN